MFLDIFNLPDYLADKWVSYANLYKDKIKISYTKWFNLEDNYGNSCKQYGQMQFYLAFFLVSMVYNELINYHTTISDTYAKYDLSEKRKKLYCNGIDLNDILTIFGLPKVNEIILPYGIEHIGIETNFIVEPINIE